MQQKYSFTNFTKEEFTGRFAGVNYIFASGETREFDPDKHYMLILLAKQLADRELIKKVKNVGRDPKDMETWGKALDEFGKPFTITGEIRKSLMKQAVGFLIDTPIPVPEDQIEEGGITKEQSEDVKQLQNQVKDLTQIVQQLTQVEKSNQPQPQTEIPSNIEEPIKEQPSMTREALSMLATDLGIENIEKMTKEELIHNISLRQAQI